MAQFSYSQYTKQQEARRQRNNNPQSRERSSVHFANEWLKKDGDTLVVRFPYHSMDDIMFETVHKVTFPGDRFPKHVRCQDKNCPLCEKGVKKSTRFLAKFIAYLVDEETNQVNLVPALWDRPAAFADVEIKNLISEYGDLSEHLFKIKRNGEGMDTRYTISIIMNKTVYNPTVYVADFSSLENIDPVVVLTKTIDQYLEAITGNESSDEEEIETESDTTSAEVEEEKPAPAQAAPRPQQREAKKYSF